MVLLISLLSLANLIGAPTENMDLSFNSVIPNANFTFSDL